MQIQYQRRLQNTSDVEAFSAAALVLHVRVVELEAFVEPFTHEIEFRPVNVRQAFRVNNDLQALTFEDQILGFRFIGVLELVGHA